MKRAGEHLAPPPLKVTRTKGHFGFPFEMAERMETQGTSAGGESSSGGAMGGTPYQPTELMHHMGNRKTTHHTIRAAGTTFIGPASDGTNTNDWFRFPWEHMPFFTRAWEKNRIPEEFLFWKCTGARLTMKNPLCIQDVGGAESGLATAGQNLHAQMFGYQDNLYTRGIATTPNIQDAQGINSLQNSWNQHGYSPAGAPQLLPKLGIDMDEFRYNFPDVKQCGMGGGNEISYSWNINSPYWRSTTQFKQYPFQGTTFDQHGLMRWDEHFGVVQQLDQGERCLLLNAGDDIRGNDGAKQIWQNVNQGTVAAEPNEAVTGIPKVCYHVDPEPMPQVFFQLQPQLGGIATGLSDSVAQVQFEVEYDIVLMGRCPSVMETNLQWTANNELPRNSYANNWLARFGKRIPMFRPIMRVGGNERTWNAAPLDDYGIHPPSPTVSPIREPPKKRAFAEVAQDGGEKDEVDGVKMKAVGKVGKRVVKGGARVLERYLRQDEDGE